MIRWWLVIGLLLSVGVNVGILAVIVTRHGGPPPPREERQQQQGQNPANPNGNPNADPVPRLGRLADRLKLEGDQRRKFLDIQWNLYQESTRQRLQMNEVHREIRREVTRPAPDRQRVEALLAESSRIHMALERALVNNILSTRELLGPEKEKEYLKIVGRLRLPNPGPGIGNPAGPPPKRRPGGFLDRFRQRRMERREQREGPPPEGEGDGNGPPPDDQRPPEGEGPPPT
ncbi:MAG TPA: periplasmic heavy metal sensor [Thermoanaerobaculia bacterium]|nr:periplasmic heavy metal sensor [Thermoanaerobaculia bacterium]